VIKVVLDACVLYPAPLRDVLLSVARVGCFSPYWSDLINDEWTRNLLANRTDLKLKDLARTTKTMNGSFPGASCSGFEDLIETLNLPDKDDRHVLALAIQTESTFIVTNNVKDFPAKILSVYGIKAIKADDFFEHLIVNEGMELLLVEALAHQRARLKFPPIGVKEFIDTIENQGLKKCGKRLRLKALSL